LNQNPRFDLSFMLRHVPDFGPAILTALEVFIAALAIALVVGVVLALARVTRTQLAWLAAAYVEIFRNTPLLMQLYFIFFGLPIVGVMISPFVSGSAAIGLQHGAFFAEILRGGIAAVRRDQREGGLALGMLPSQVMRQIVLPQALRNSLPAAGNQLVLLLQDTSFVSTIGIFEITLRGQTIAERSAASFEMFVVVGAIYLLLSAILSLAARGLEFAAAYAR
jgi:His/Glu/Gln/Arg/opine family amino acid ABC transporter permease subunit